MRPITDLCSHYGLFFDDSGYFVGKQKIKWSNKTFSFSERSFNFLPSESSFFKIKTLFSTKKYYHYNINNPNPLLLNKRQEPVLNSKIYKTVLDSDLVTKLNPKTNPLLAFLGSPKGLLLIGAVLVAVWYFSSGGSVS